MYNPRLAVFSTKPIINYGKAIVHVVHDPTGEWQFLSDDNVTIEDLMIVALESLLEKDRTLSEVIGMAPGYEAKRDKVGGAWQIVEYKEYRNIMNETSKKWLEAAKKLGPDPYQKVICPECSISHLMVKDELILNWGKIDRYLICDNCGKWNVMTMAIPEKYSIDSPVDTSKDR